jgi:TolB protein
MRTRALALALLTCAAAGSATAERPAVVVTPGSERTFRAALQRFASSDEKGAQAFGEALAAGLEYSGVFQVLDPKAFLAPVVSGPLSDDPPVCSDWTPIGADALVRGALREEPGEFVAEFEVWDTTRCMRLERKRYRQATDADRKRVAKRIADDVVAAFIGLRGVSSTEIAFISDRGGNSEVFVMDADGSNARPATANGSINAFPSWSPQGDAIVYTSYRYRNRPYLFLSARANRRPGLLLPNLDGRMSQFRGVFDPSGHQLAVVMADGQVAADIYRVGDDGNGLRRLTRDPAIDIAPSWSPDGKQIAFVSDRTGAPQIYIMDAEGGKARRLTYEGSYNTHPAWSPDGRWIAYESRIGSQFDIWLIDVEGKVNVPLVDNPRSDEGPTWAPNSRKLAFSSTRRGRSDIYVIDVSGENLRRLTSSAGDNKSPAWGPFPR